MKAAIYFGLAITVFLAMLNGFLRGAKRHHIDALLSVVLVGLLLASFTLLGWKAALFAIILAFAFGAAFRPVAARFAVHLMSLGGKSGTYPGLPPSSLERISRELGRPLSQDNMIGDFLANRDRKRQAEEALFDYCLAHPPTRSLLAEHGADRTRLEELYKMLCIAGAAQWAGGHWVAASALAYPDSLRFLLANMEGGVSHLEQAYRLLMHFERGTPIA